MEKINSTLATSRLRVHGHTFNTSICIMAYAIIAEYFQIQATTVLLIVAITLSTNFENKKFVWPTVFLITTLGLSNASFALPTYLSCLSVDQKSHAKSLKPFALILEKTLTYLSNLTVTLIRPTFGTNSTAHQYYTNFTQAFVERAINLRDQIFGIGGMLDEMSLTMATYIRTNGIAKPPLPIEEINVEEPSVVVQKYFKTAEQFRLCAVGFIALLMLVISGIPAMFATCLVVLIWFYQKPLSGLTRVKISNRGPPIKDGIYHISTKSFLPFLYEAGIGVTINNVLHVPYHVCYGNPIQINNTIMYPFYVNITKDLVTYGNVPQIRPPTTEMDIYVNLETTSSRTTYFIGQCYKYSDDTLVIPSLTEPGHSGSPIYGFNDDDLVLLGLAGRYVGEVGVNPSEFHQLANEIEVVDEVEKIIEHPGYGKTHKVVPLKIREALLSNPQLKVLVTGPTRIVCQELYRSLSTIGNLRVSLNTKGSEHRKSRAHVEIAAHRTALKMLTTGDLNIKFYSTIIIDEAHQEDTATILLRRYVRQIPSVKVIEMSATLDGIYNDSSNYHIRNVPISKESILPMCQEALNLGRRILIFVPSLQSKEAVLYINAFKDFKPILLSRKTLSANLPHLQDLSRQLIISTDISEIGINIPELDEVFDSFEKFTYVENSGIISPTKKYITKASYVQRRGRVGRTKEGVYNFVPHAFSEEETVAHYDANLLSYGRSWGNVDEHFPFSLTDKQYVKWLDSDLTPFRIFLKYDQLGAPRGPEQIDHIWEMLTGRGTLYPGCNSKNCRCSGRYLFLDLRDHDVLFVNHAI